MARLATQKITGEQEKFLSEMSEKTGESRASIVRQAIQKILEDMKAEA